MYRSAHKVESRRMGEQLVNVNRISVYSMLVIFVKNMSSLVPTVNHDQLLQLSFQTKAYSAEVELESDSPNCTSHTICCSKILQQQ